MQAVEQKEQPVFSKHELFSERFQLIGVCIFLLLTAIILFYNSSDGLQYLITHAIFLLAFIAYQSIIIKRNWNNEIDFQVIPYKDSLRTIFFDYTAKRVRGILRHYRFVSVKKFVINLDKEDEIIIIHKTYLFRNEYALYRSNFDSEEEWFAIREKFKHVMH